MIPPNRMIRAVPAVVALVLAAGCAGAHTEEAAPTPAAPAAAHGIQTEFGVQRVRAATAAFASLDSAVAAGYAAVVERCYAHAEHGAMGFHHVNRALMDARVEVERPEILLYERLDDGRYVLNGVEYIVPYRVWPKDSVPPKLMGRDMFKSEPLQLWYTHMWVWTPNRAGLFADWNPAVRCPEAKAP